MGGNVVGVILTLRRLGWAEVEELCGRCCTQPALGLSNGPLCRPRWPLWPGRETLLLRRERAEETSLSETSSTWHCLPCDRLH